MIPRNDNDGEHLVDEELHAIATDWAFERCPRCLGQLRKSPRDGGAWSRTDRDNDGTAPLVIVCDRCGQDEAVRLQIESNLVSRDEWPLLNGAHDHCHVSA